MMSETEPSQKHVLICDDDVEGCAFVKVLLSERGYSVSHAADGEAGLKAIRTLKPALVLLDLDMPVKSGLDVLTELRNDPSPDTPAVVVLSNHESDALRDLCAMLGARATLAKSSMHDELLGRIDSLIGEKAPRS